MHEPADTRPDGSTDESSLLSGPELLRLEEIARKTDRTLLECDLSPDKSPEAAPTPPGRTDSATPPPHRRSPDQAPEPPRPPGSMQPVPRKEPGLAIIMAIFVPFSGHIYAGRVGRAIVGLVLWAASTALGLVLATSSYGEDQEKAPGFLILAALLWLGSLFSAASAVREENQQNGHAG